MMDDQKKDFDIPMGGKILALHEDSDRQSVVFGDLQHDARVPDVGLLYCDTMQLASMPRDDRRVIVTALPSPRVALLVSRRGVLRSVLDVRYVVCAVKDASHAKLLAALLRACDVFLGSIGLFFSGEVPDSVENDAGTAFFACCTGEELRDLRGADACVVPYGDYLRAEVLREIVPHARVATVHSLDWVGGCFNSLQTLVTVDTVLCCRPTALVSRAHVDFLVRRLGGEALAATRRLSTFFELHGSSDSRVHVGSSVVAAPAPGPPSSPRPVPPALLSIDANLFASLYLSTRDGSGLVHVAQRGEVRPEAEGRYVARPDPPGRTRERLVVNVASVSDGGVRLSVPPQPDVARDSPREYRCVVDFSKASRASPPRVFSEDRCLELGGVWDRPCVHDDDCPFSDWDGARFGCDRPSGFCVMPVGVTNAAYRRYVFDGKSSFPVCHHAHCDPSALFGSPVREYADCCARHLADRGEKTRETNFSQVDTTA